MAVRDRTVVRHRTSGMAMPQRMANGASIRPSVCMDTGMHACMQLADHPDDTGRGIQPLIDKTEDLTGVGVRECNVLLVERGVGRMLTKKSDHLKEITATSLCFLLFVHLQYALKFQCITSLVGLGVQATLVSRGHHVEVRVGFWPPFFALSAGKEPKQNP